MVRVLANPDALRSDQDQNQETAPGVSDQLRKPSWGVRDLLSRVRLQWRLMTRLVLADPAHKQSRDVSFSYLLDHVELADVSLGEFGIWDQQVIPEKTKTQFARAAIWHNGSFLGVYGAKGTIRHQRISCTYLDWTRYDIKWVVAGTEFSAQLWRQNRI